MTYRLNLSGLVVAAERMQQGAEKAVQEAAEFLLTEANKTVPHDEGTLERSGSVSGDGLTAAVSYDTPYAARQHEDIAFHHPGKGEAKWLENTLTSEADTVGRVVQTAMRRELGT